MTGLVGTAGAMLGIDLTDTYRKARGSLLYGLAGMLLNAAERVGSDIPSGNFDIALALTGASSDLMTMEQNLRAEDIDIDTERLKRETERLRAYTKEHEAKTDHLLGHPGYRAGERILLLGGLAAGHVDRNELSDAVFHSRHPERSGEKLDPKNKDDGPYIREWNKIAGGLVPSVLGSEVGKLLTISKRTGVGRAAGARSAGRH